MKNIARVLLIGLLGLGTVACTATRTQQSTGEYIDDAVITTRVKADLFDAAKLKAFDIKVKVFKGIVQLSGFIESQALKDEATRIARGVVGVKDVKNDLLIK